MSWLNDSSHLNPTFFAYDFRHGNFSAIPAVQDVFCHVSDLQDGEGSVVEAADLQPRLAPGPGESDDILWFLKWVITIIGCNWPW